jgi:hypothetical protein
MRIVKLNLLPFATCEVESPSNRPGVMVKNEENKMKNNNRLSIRTLNKIAISIEMSLNHSCELDLIDRLREKVTLLFALTLTQDQRQTHQFA